MEPLAGKVVHAAGPHQGQNPHRDLLGKGLTTGEGIAPLAGQRRCHHSQVMAGDGDGTLTEVEIQGRLRVRFDDVEIT